MRVFLLLTVSFYIGDAQNCQDSDCRPAGRSPYDGYYCKPNNECGCSTSRACKDFDDSIECQNSQDCPGYDEVNSYLISCQAGKCQCNKQSACQGTDQSTATPVPVCDEYICLSLENNYRECIINETISSVEVMELYETSTCDYRTLNDLPGQGGTYGYYDNVLWVNGGCKARFQICTFDAGPTTTVPEEDCLLNIQCSGSCVDLLNPQDETTLTIDVGCSSAILMVAYQKKKCGSRSITDCTDPGTVHEISGNSILYKPSDATLFWKYHGLFVDVSLDNGGQLSDSVILEFGPIPTAGSCDISPQTGYALTTSYNLTCSGFSITGGYQLKFSVYAGVRRFTTYRKASKILTNAGPRSQFLLPPGLAANEYSIYIWVKAYTSYGASLMVEIETQVYPPSFADNVNVVDLAENLVGTEQGSSPIKELISGGNVEEASQLLSVVSASLNSKTENVTESDADIKKKKNVRTAIVSLLTELPVTDIESVSSSISVLNEATQVTEEVSSEAQELATNLYSNLADGFDQFVSQQSATDAIHTAGSILSGVTRILDLNTDTGMSQMNQSTAAKTQETATQTTAKVEKAKRSTVKLLKTVDTVSSTMMLRQPTGANTTKFTTETMMIGIQKLTRHSLSRASYSATEVANSSGSFVFPYIADRLVSGQTYGVKMLYVKKNPYIWSGTSQDITSPVMSIALKDNNKTDIEVDNLNDPVSISLSNFGQEASSVHTFQVALRKIVGNMTDSSDGNVTFSPTKPNMISFNVTALKGRTLTLSIAPVSNITSYKMLIKRNGKPSFSEILSNGFLYPEEVVHSKFAKFKYLKTAYTPSQGERLIYLTEGSSLSSSDFSGTYYIGLTLDLNHTQTLDTLLQDYPTCLGSNNGSECVEIVNVTVDIQTKQLGCLYWSEKNEIWSSEGCEVSPYTTRETIECLCSHLTAFSASYLVMPNMVDPFDVSLFLTFFDNPVVVTAVVIIWVIYAFLAHWARQADKKDIEKVGVINCLDNSPTENYIYLVCAVTGWWKDAGTSANVFILLKGTKGTSSTHCLTSTARPCFQTGSEDWFLVTTEQSLGELKEVTLWHDNIGASPHWYLNHVFVKDIQLRKSWHFIFNDWLAADRGSLLQTSVTLVAVTEEELKFKQKHNFMVKSTQDLRDGHLWLSIFSKPAKSTFTRVQRLTCGLSLLLTTMLTNIMFYGIPTDNPEDQLGTTGPFAISLSAIIIGIESSLIMFPVNLLILQLFLKAKPRPRKNQVKLSKKTYEHLETVFDACSRLTDTIMTDILNRLITEELPVDLKHYTDKFSEVSKGGETLSRKESREGRPSLRKKDTSSLKPGFDTYNPNRGKSLPWWVLYIGWFLVISTSLVSSYFVMLYGLKYGYAKSVNWLVSFLTGFTQSACVTQPLKVICIAVIITLILKKPAEFDDFGPDVELDEDEVYLHEVVGAEEIHHPTVEPLSKRLLEKIRQRLHVEWLMDMTLIDMVLYAIYLGIFTFMVHAHRNTNLVYRNNVAIEDVLVNPGCINLNNCFFLAKADKVDLMYQYFEEVLFPSLADMSVADHGYATPGSNHFLLGPFRLRQQRIQKGTCDKALQTISARFGQTLPDCVGSYWLGDEDTGSYDNSWKKPLEEPLTTGGPWSHQSMWTLKTLPYGGLHATYSGGGYVLEFPQSSDWGNILNSIKNTDWIDDRTRAIFAEFTLYNPNADLFSVVMIFFEFTNMGGIFPSHQIFTAKLYHYSSNIGPYVATCEFLFVVFNIVFTYTEIKRYKKIGRKEYFNDIWNIAEVIQLALTYTVLGLFLKRMLSVDDIMNDFRASNGQTFVSFYTAIAWDFILGYVMAFQLAFITLKTVKLLRFNKRMFMISDTITFAKSNLLSFAFVFVVFMIAFGHFSSQAFGTMLYGYKSFGSSIFTMLNFALGASDLPGMFAANRILGPIFFVVFVFFSQWCLLTIFMAILNFGINDSKAKSGERMNKFELVDYVWRKVKSIW